MVLGVIREARLMGKVVNFLEVRFTESCKRGIFLEKVFGWLLNINDIFMVLGVIRDVVEE